jgi:PII-like signaling protein
MELPHEAVLLRIFTSTADRCGLEPLYLAIVARARAQHLAGATVLCGPLGFGRSAQLHEGHFWPPAQDLPVVIEIVDSEDKITGFLPILDAMMESGLVTMERAQVLQYGRSRLGLLARLRQQWDHHPAPSPTTGPAPPA